MVAVHPNLQRPDRQELFRTDPPMVRAPASPVRRPSQRRKRVLPTWTILRQLPATGPPLPHPRHRHDLAADLPRTAGWKLRLVGRFIGMAERPARGDERELLGLWPR